ncbi:MAG: DUF4394 domain-containing protein [Burkholderiaceae bacterium]
MHLTIRFSASAGRVPALALATALALSGCAAVEPPPPQAAQKPAAESVIAVTAAHELIRFNAGQPSRIASRKTITGLATGDALIGIDFRIARGVLYAVGQSGQLYTLDPATAALSRVGAPTAGTVLAGRHFGVDFNPVADRLRVVSDTGANWRLHPDTGAAVDGDAASAGLQPDATLAWTAGDASAGSAPGLLGAAYTYNKQNDKLTTNYAIERRGLLVIQGSREGMQPVVSPNTGQLTTVGALGTGPIDDASFDIADVSGAAYAALRIGGSTLWVRIDLATGRATRIGTLDITSGLRGIAIEP